jgi:hypothetical protein
MVNFIKTQDIIDKFIQSEINKGIISNEQLIALNEVTNLEDLIYEIGSWESDILHDNPSIAHYILINLDWE